MSFLGKLTELTEDIAGSYADSIDFEQSREWIEEKFEQDITESWGGALESVLNQKLEELKLDTPAILGAVRDFLQIREEEE